MSNPWNEFKMDDLNYRNEYNLPPPNPVRDMSMMSWSTLTTPSQVMQFKALGQYQEHTVPLHAKRKHPLPPEPIPTKKMLTEERMAAHLSNLHISSNEERNPFQPVSSCEDSNINNYTVNMSQWDLERKLRTAQKITICNELLEFDRERDNLLPEILLNRIEKPCSALVLWQPPPLLASLIDSGSDKDGKKQNKKETPRHSDEMETELT